MYKILAPEQCRFRKRTDIENAVFTLTDIMLTSLNHQQQTVGIFCDLSKAFECINLVILLNIFEKHVTTGLNHVSQTGNKKLI